MGDICCGNPRTMVLGRLTTHEEIYTATCTQSRADPFLGKSLGPIVDIPNWGKYSHATPGVEAGFSTFSITLGRWKVLCSRASFRRRGHEGNGQWEVRAQAQRHSMAETGRQTQWSVESTFSLKWHVRGQGCRVPIRPICHVFRLLASSSSGGESVRHHLLIGQGAATCRHLKSLSFQNTAEDGERSTTILVPVG